MKRTLNWLLANGLFYAGHVVGSIMHSFNAWFLYEPYTFCMTKSEEIDSKYKFGIWTVVKSDG